MSELPYHNVFTSYRGPSSRRDIAEGSDPQLEDNATKALMNVLELAPSSSVLTRSFLTEVAQLPNVPSEIVPEFFLQGGPGVVDAGARFLLGLSVSGDPPAAGEVEGVEGRGRVDAAIYVPGRMLCAVEVKVGSGELAHSQLERHAKRWGVGSEADWLFASWADCYRWAAGQRANHDPVSAFLLEQLLGFLRAAELAPFLGFEQRDFDFFAAPADERTPRSRQHIRVLMLTCWEAVERALGVESAARIGKARLQSIKPYERTAALSTPAHKRGVNLTVELWPSEVQANLVGWNDPQVARLIEWLRTPEAPSWLHAHPEFEVVVFRRFATSFTREGKPIWQSQAEAEIPGHIPAREFSVEQLERKLREIPTLDRPGIHLRLAWPSAVAIEMGAAIVGEIAKVLQMLQPLVEKINPAASAR